MRADLRLGPSDIAGAGVFAAEPLESGLAVDAEHGFNHSCDPNLWWTDGELVTRRAIAVGEELTFDYASADADPGFLLRCHCETYRCRQMVTGDDWQIEELRKRYDGHWAPAVQRLISG